MSEYSDDAMEAELLFEEVDLFSTALIQGNCTNVTYTPDELPVPESADAE